MTLSNRASESSSSLHFATIAHGGLIWDAYLQFDDDPRSPTSFRASIRFVPPTASADGGPAPAETTVVIIEGSYDAAVAKARAFDDRQLQGFLRSALPGDEE